MNKPISNSLAARDIAYHAASLHQCRCSTRPKGRWSSRRGKGIYVYDENGKEYIEGLAGLWCASLGFGEERLVEAAARQMREAALLPQLRPQGARRRPSSWPSG